MSKRYPCKLCAVAQKDSLYLKRLGGVRLGKAYVSFHLMALYMCPEMQKSITPALKKRMQGKTCFNFKTQPEPELLAAKSLTTMPSAVYEDVPFPPSVVVMPLPDHRFPEGRLMPDLT